MKEKSLQSGDDTNSISEILRDAIDASKDVSFPDALATLMPWAKLVGDVASPVLPLVKLIAHFGDKLLKENSSEKLGLKACTMAYLRAIELAFKQVGAPTGERRAIHEAKAQLCVLSRLEDLDMSTFSLDTPEQHEFYKQAAYCLQVVAIGVGYTHSQVDKVASLVQENFCHLLTRLLSDGGTREKFAPFSDYLNLGGADNRRSHTLLAQHARYQQWLYEKAPVLRVSPFALKHVYIETDCGILNWGNLNQPQRHGEDRINAFSEEHGGRHPLLETVLDLIGSDTLGEAIVIQGSAGWRTHSFPGDTYNHHIDLSGARFIFESLTSNIGLVSQLESAKFDFVFFDRTKLDREEALQRLCEVFTQNPPPV